MKAASGPAPYGRANDKSAKPENLVAQFQRRQKPDPKMQICPATQPRRALPWADPDVKAAPGDVNPAGVLDAGRAGAANPGPVFRVDVNFTTVPVVVTDRNGSPVPDLKASDFHVFEDGLASRRSTGLSQNWSRFRLRSCWMRRRACASASMKSGALPSPSFSLCVRRTG